MDGGFRFIVEEVFALPGRGVVATGKVENGSILVGTEAGFTGTDGKWAKARVAGIEVSRRLVDEAQTGEKATLLLEGIRKDQLALGTLLTEVPASPVQMTSAPAQPLPPTLPPPYSPPPSGGAIHPSSGLGPALFILVVGVLIILAILYLQGKL